MQYHIILLQNIKGILLYLIIYCTFINFLGLWIHLFNEKVTFRWPKWADYVMQAGSQPASQLARQADSQLGRQLASQAGSSQLGLQIARQLASYAGRQLARQLTSQAGRQPAIQAGSQPAGRQVASQLGRQLASQAGCQPARLLIIELHTSDKFYIIKYHSLAYFVNVEGGSLI